MIRHCLTSSPAGKLSALAPGKATLRRNGGKHSMSETPQLRPRRRELCASSGAASAEATAERPLDPPPSRLAERSEPSHSAEPSLDTSRGDQESQSVGDGGGVEPLTWEQDMERRVLQQVELEAQMGDEWRKWGLSLTGRARGSPSDPYPGGDMDFSDLMNLLQQNRVQFVEYGDYGRHIAAILPHSVRDTEDAAPETTSTESASSESAATGPSETETSAVENQTAADPQEVVWLKHKIRQVPADAHNLVWAQLRPQLVNVKVVNHQNTIGSLVIPTLALAAAWAVRLVVAIALYRFVDKLLLPFYKPTKIDDRPRSSARKLSAALDPALGTMGQSRARFISAEERTGVTFDDFAGQDYVKRELQEVVKILREAKEFEELGVYCPKGVMLFGPPGTGKTLLARAIAGEAGVPFFSVSGAEFVEMFAGVAASRVKDLFFRARLFSPSIIFIDEIDAIGAKRGSGSSLDGGSIEREQGLIQILTELDGFQESEAKVLVIGATNRLDMLDPALLRKGRFDKVLRVGLPTEAGRYSILQVHAKNKNFKSEAERDTLLREVAGLTQDFSGAELMNVMNEAAILAVREDKDEIERDQLLQALDRQAGEFKTGEEDVVESREVRLRTAYREAAIAVLACVLPDPGRPLLRTTLEDFDPLPNVEYVNVRHRVFSRKHDMLNALVRAFSTASVEQILFGAEGMSWQAGVAYRQAVQIADFIILRSGLSALGTVTYETEKDLMKHLRPKVVALRDEYLRYARQKCDAILLEHRAALDAVADRLVQNGVIEAEEIQNIFNSSIRDQGVSKVREIDEHRALLYVGKWGIYGVSLPGRATFSPGNSGYVTFGAPRPQQVRRINDETWKTLDQMWQERVRDLDLTDTTEAEVDGLAQVNLLEPEFL